MLEFHDAANIFPLDEENIDALAKDIKANGQQVAIELLDGKILDGRRRYAACSIAQVKPVTRDVKTDDPIAYVVSLNLHRRHLTPSQLSIVGAKVREMYDAQAKERQKRKPNSVVVTLPEQKSKGTARDLAGKAVGVSGSLIDRATKVLKEAQPEVVKAVEDGRMSVSTAADLVGENPDVQRTAASQAKFQGGRYRNQKPKEEEEEQPAGKERGVGVTRGHEAVNILMRIPKNDALRKRGFQIVTDWIRKNK